MGFQTKPTPPAFGDVFVTGPSRTYLHDHHGLPPFGYIFFGTADTVSAQQMFYDSSLFVVAARILVHLSSSSSSTTTATTHTSSGAMGGAVVVPGSLWN